MTERKTIYKLIWVWDTLLMYALGRVHGKKEALEKDRQLRE